MTMHKPSVAAAILAGALAGTAQAALIDRGGGLVYDDVLDITWLQDANFAHTTGVAAATSGLMTWAESLAWVSSLAYYDSVRDQTLTGWRLPDIAPVGTDFIYSFSIDGTTDYGTGNMSPNSELAYMYYVNLGNVGYPKVGAGLVDDPLRATDESLFINLGGLQCSVDESRYCPTFWSSTRYEWNPIFPTNNDAVWVFDMSNGVQSGDYEYKRYFAWAVRDGDVGADVEVPEPGAFALLALGGLGIVGGRRLQRRA